MDIRLARRLSALPAYAFAVIDEKVRLLREAGADPVDLGVGDPAVATPELIRRACQEAVDERATAGYPSTIGDLGFRQAVAGWTAARFGVTVDADSEVSTTIGSKEGIFHFAEAFVDPGDVVLAPSPGYPPYSRGALFAEGTPWFYPLDAQAGFLPDLLAIPDAVADRAKVLWVNYPNSPTGRCADLAFYKNAYAWCQARGIILASDEAYSELWYTEAPPPSALEVGKDGVVVFNSLSKRSAMTCYRIGWVAGDPRIVAGFRKVKTNLDSGAATFIQDAATAALRDETHVEQMRAEYLQKADMLVAALRAAGLQAALPQGTVYLWQKAPCGMTGLDLAQALLRPEVAIVGIPGELISEPLPDGRNPGRDYVRLSLTPSVDDVEKACERLRRLSF
ncbi:MAG: aminotransferase class I/II-fold pyridoxal phosphate-dependent enzyme [Myxococcota bacterium]|jgi:LL-diaminopimelate aminotransferase|nr:aminotransferase class I/II-fold pyridoxal phosphate-dependent enzyme [Myxococcota bacterium]